MAITFLILSTLVQLAALVQAMRLAWQRWRLGWVLLAVAMVLMLGRRAFSLYGVLAQDRMLDQVAEFLAVLISVLLLTGLTLPLRWRPSNEVVGVEAPDFETRSTESLKKQALLLGLLALLGTTLLSYLAYVASRDAITDRLGKGSLDLAHLLETSATLSGTTTSGMLPALERLWKTSQRQYPENYLCVIGADGQLLLNTRRPEMVGRDVGSTRLPTARAGAPKSVRELVVARQDWVGRNRSAEGLEQIAGYAYSTNLSALLAVHQPAAGVDHQVYEELLPWLIGLVLSLTAILPLSLGLLYRVSSSSQHTTVAALQKQHRSDERFRRIVETAHEGIWTFDTDGMTTFVNARMAGMLGWSVHEMIGQPMSRFMEDESRATADNATRQRQWIVEQREHKFLHRDGSTLWALLATNPLLDENGQNIGALAMVADITECKRLERQLTETTKRLRTIIETEPECVKIIGPAGELLEMNPAGLAMLEVSSLEQAQSGTLSEFIVPEHREAFKRLHHSIFRGESGTLEFRIVGLRGTPRWMDTHAVPLRDDAGKVTALLGVTRDITVRYVAEQAIRQINAELEQRVRERTVQLEFANNELESFSYSVSHDLRSPLRHIQGFADIVRHDATSNLSEVSRKHLQTVCGAAEKMGRLIEDLLKLSKVSRAAMRKRPVDLSAVAAEVAGELAQHDPWRVVNLVIAPELKANGDPFLLRVVFVNLLGNAWKYTRKQPAASIEVGQIERDAEKIIFVRDNGAGFEMEYADKLFGAFQRMHTQEDFEGTGVGLATVQRIVHRHGGRIWADAAVNRGATFFFTLPD